MYIHIQILMSAYAYDALHNLCNATHCYILKELSLSSIIFTSLLVSPELLDYSFAAVIGQVTGELKDSLFPWFDPVSSINIMPV